MWSIYKYDNALVYGYVKEYLVETFSASSALQVGTFHLMGPIK